MRTHPSRTSSLHPAAPASAPLTGPAGAGTRANIAPPHRARQHIAAAHLGAPLTSIPAAETPHEAPQASVRRSPARSEVPQASTHAAAAHFEVPQAPTSAAGMPPLADDVRRLGPDHLRPIPA